MPIKNIYTICSESPLAVNRPPGKGIQIYKLIWHVFSWFFYARIFNSREKLKRKRDRSAGGRFVVAKGNCKYSKLHFWPKRAHTHTHTSTFANKHRRNAMCWVKGFKNKNVWSLNKNQNKMWAARNTSWVCVCGCVCEPKCERVCVCLLFCCLFILADTRVYFYGFKMIFNPASGLRARPCLPHSLRTFYPPPTLPRPLTPTGCRGRGKDGGRGGVASSAVCSA